MRNFGTSRPRLDRSPRQRGQGLIEYAIVIALIALVVIAVAQQVGNKTKVAFCSVSNGFANAGFLADWGSDQYGQLGNGTSGAGTFSGTATAVNGVCSVAAAAGGYHTLAVNPQGQVYGWGDNQYDELGQGGPSPALATAPVLISGGWKAGSVTQVAASYHSLALGVDASTGLTAVWAWGDDDCGQTGQPGQAVGSCAGAGTGLPLTASPTEVIVPGVTSGNPITAIATGGKLSMALLQNGAVYTWGGNTSGQLGQNLTSDNNGHSSPGQVCNTAPGAVGSCNNNFLTGVTSIDGGLAHALALVNNGVDAWGDNTYGQLGNNSTVMSLYPVVVQNVGGGGALANIKTIERGAQDYHNIVVSTTGLVYAWGDDQYGELGDWPGPAVGGTAASRVPVVTCGGQPCQMVPVAVLAVGGAVGSQLSLANSVARGNFFSIAVLNNGTAVSWGRNDATVQQLGLGSTSGNGACGCIGYPTAVPGIISAKSVNAGFQHALLTINPGGSPVPSN